MKEAAKAARKMATQFAKEAKKSIKHLEARRQMQLFVGNQEEADRCAEAIQALTTDLQGRK
ncbi:MAG TPA: hypothetical protein VJP02_26925 [Candidatus Sulfotelmatobacter sp.]|nr:hypothetical protein [Candidatus Sulfotelmatobacter sp.]